LAEKHNTNELCWAAGFVDGEGNIRWNSHKKNMRGGMTRSYGTISFSVAQVDREVLDKLHRILGVGGVYGPYGPYHENKNSYFQFSAQGKDAEDAFVLLRPFLSTIKAKQGDDAISKYREQQSRPRLKRGRKEGTHVKNS